MISMSQVKVHFLTLFRLMRDTGMHVDLHNQGHVYRLSLEDMGYKVQMNRGRKAKPSLVGNIQAQDCPACGKLMVNEICMSAKCHYSQPGAHTPPRP